MDLSTLILFFFLLFSTLSSFFMAQQLGVSFPFSFTLAWEPFCNGSGTVQDPFGKCRRVGNGSSTLLERFQHTPRTVPEKSQSGSSTVLETVPGPKQKGTGPTQFAQVGPRSICGPLRANRDATEMFSRGGISGSISGHIAGTQVGPRWA